MDLGLSEFQRGVRDAARSFLAEKVTKSLRQELEADEAGHSAALWREMARLGWIGLGVPEAYGGVGASLVDIAVLVEEMGFAAYMSPFVQTAVLGAGIIAHAGTEQQKQDLLPRIADGSLVLATAIAEPPGCWTADGIQSAFEGGTLSGEKHFVEYATSADNLIVFARVPDTRGEGGLCAALVDVKDDGVTCVDMRAAAGRQYAVTLSRAAVPSGYLIATKGGAGLLRHAVEVNAAVNCAFMVGLAQRALDMTVNHAQTRTQFGQPLGKFQAVQHHCADMATLTEGTRLLTYETAWRLDTGLPAAKEVAMAKAFTNEATRQTLWLAHQIHGGVGIMKEYDLHFYFRAAKSLELTVGGTLDHLQTVADELQLVP